MGPKYFTPKLLRGHFCRDFNIPRVKNVIVGTIYRQPDENVNDVLDSLRKLLSTTSRENKICYVMGDFNLDLLRHEQHAITGEFVELMFSHLLYSMITKPTRITSNTTSLTDNVFTNNVTCLNVHGLIVNDLSDHLPIFSISDTSTKRESIVVHDFKDEHVNNFLSSLERVDNNNNNNNKLIGRILINQMPIQPMNLLLINSVRYITKTSLPKPFNLSIVFKNHVVTLGSLKAF